MVRHLERDAKPAMAQGIANPRRAARSNLAASGAFLIQAEEALSHVLRLDPESPLRT
jgi:hypothetical protein